MLRILNKKPDTQHGDTIVEVLIAIIVVSSILTGVYYLARNSLIQNRQAQERTEGLKLVEGQVEALRASAAQANSPVFSQQDVFCLTGSNAVANPLTAITPAGGMVALTADLPSDYQPNIQPSNCGTVQDTIGTQDINFNLSIDPCSPAASGPGDCSSNVGTADPTGQDITSSTPNLFIVRARWDSASGTGREEAKLLYRIYPFGLSGAVEGP